MDLLNPIKAAEYLKDKIHPNSLVRMARQGRLRTTRIGSRYFFAPEDLDKLITISDPTADDGHDQ